MGNPSWPNTIIIGGIPFALQFAEHVIGDGGLSLVGQIDYEHQTIQIKEGTPDQTKGLTILHECLHGIMVQAGINEHDEQLIEQLSYGLTTLMYLNPNLFAKLGNVFSP